MLLTALAFTGIFAVSRSLRNGWYACHVAVTSAVAWLVGFLFPPASPGSDIFSTDAFVAVAILHLIMINLVTFLAYWWDKRAAYGGGWRIPERTLHAFAFIGGTPGAFLGQKVFRHKTLKKQFRQMFVAILILQVCLGVAMLWWVSSSPVAIP